MIIEERAYARAGLLGNPSDGYYGKTISISVKNFGARVSLYQTPELNIEPPGEDLPAYPNMHTFIESIERHGYYGAERLVKAAIKKFILYCNSENIPIENKNFTIRYNSNIPRQVGLAGSSAIITATFRALMKFYGVKIPREILPTLIYKTETEELGITAGLQDRVIQVYEGCVYMDFEEKYVRRRQHGKYESLDISGFENLYIAYKVELSKVSGVVLNDIKSRYDKGDKHVIDTLSEIADCAQEGVALIKSADYDLHDLINRNFDLRSKIMTISDRNKEMIEIARNCGASAKFAGSGGSIIGIFANNEMLTRLIVEMKKINARVIRPYIS